MNDKDLLNFKQDNGYEIDGVWYPRVTTIINMKAKPALYQFYGGLSSFKEGEAIKNRSAEEGTLVHETIEAIMEGKEITIPELVRPTVDAYLKFIMDTPINPLQIERRIVSAKHRYAGTLDVLAEVKGKIGVLDIKTSNAIYRDYNIQTSAYVAALEEDKSIPPLTRWILRLDQHKICSICGAKLRTKGGRPKVRGGNWKCQHQWGFMEGEVEFKELDNYETDIRAFLACKTLWEWENEEYLKQIK